VKPQHAYAASLPALAFAAILALAPSPARAGAQAEEALAPSVATVLSRAISDQAVPGDWESRGDARAWVASMDARLATRIPDAAERREFLRSVHYESVRAGLDPFLVLAVIHHESAFRKYAVSIADARGYMQVMPFWTRLIGSPGHNLFHLRTNLRYGCVILRHYIDREQGDLYRALGRYNGSLGRPEYPTAVMTAMQRYAPTATASTVRMGADGATLGAVSTAR